MGCGNPNCDCCKSLALAASLALGVNGTPGSLWYLGSGVPSGTLGVINDLYLNTANGDYYQKTGLTTWTLKGNLTGASGGQWSTGSGAPSGGSGNVGDMYLDVATGNVYQKTGSSTWTLEGNIKGADGTNGVIILYNDLSQLNSDVVWNPDTGGVPKIFETQNIPANTLVNNKDRVAIQVTLQCQSTIFGGAPYGLVAVGGNAVVPNLYFSSNSETVVVDITIDRISSTSYLLKATSIDYIGGVTSSSQIITGADFTSTIAVDVIANTNGDAGGIVCMGHYAEYKQF